MHSLKNKAQKFSTIVLGRMPNFVVNMTNSMQNTSPREILCKYVIWGFFRGGKREGEGVHRANRLAVAMIFVYLVLPFPGSFFTLITRLKEI